MFLGSTGPDRCAYAGGDGDGERGAAEGAAPGQSGPTRAPEPPDPARPCLAVPVSLVHITHHACSWSSHSIPAWSQGCQSASGSVSFPLYISYLHIWSSQSMGLTLTYCWKFVGGGAGSPRVFLWQPVCLCGPDDVWCRCRGDFTRLSLFISSTGCIHYNMPYAIYHFPHFRSV